MFWLIHVPVDSSLSLIVHITAVSILVIKLSSSTVHVTYDLKHLFEGKSCFNLMLPSNFKPQLLSGVPKRAKMVIGPKKGQNGDQGHTGGKLWWRLESWSKQLG